MTKYNEITINAYINSACRILWFHSPTQSLRQTKRKASNPISQRITIATEDGTKETTETGEEHAVIQTYDGWGLT